MSLRRHVIGPALFAGIVVIGVFLTYRFFHGDPGLELRMAANAGDQARVEALLGKHPGIVNSRDIRWLDPSAIGWTNAPQGHLLLREFFSKYLLNQARSLIDGKPEVTSQGPVLTCSFGLHEVNGGTALHQAVFGRQPDVVELLCKAGANPNLQDRSGATPLMAAVWTEQDGIVKVLLEAGADPKIRDKSGISLLEHARLRERIRRHADPKLHESDERTIHLLESRNGVNDEVEPR